MTGLFDFDLAKAKLMKDIFVVSLFEEGFGQITRRVLKIFISEESGKKFIAKNEKTVNDWEPYWYELECLALGTTYFGR